LSTFNETHHDQLHRALVDHIAGQLRPRRSLWPVRRRLALWLLLEIAVLLQTITETRGNWAARFASAPYTFEILFFAVAGLILAAMALRAAIPGREARPWQTVLAIVLAISGIALLFVTPMRTDMPLSQFISVGVVCVFFTCSKAALPLIALWWAVRRGAPGNGRAAGAMVGAAAMLFSFAIMRIDCPLDEPLHLITWHLGPVIAVTVLSAVAGALWLRFPLRRHAVSY
jgi:hypothetical protein